MSGLHIRRLPCYVSTRLLPIFILLVLCFRRGLSSTSLTLETTSCVQQLQPAGSPRRTKHTVPPVSYAAKSPFLTSLRSPYFFCATYEDSSQVHTIKSIIKFFGWREVVPVYIDNFFGEGIMPRLTDALQEINAGITYRSVIALNATEDEISVELLNMMTTPTRVSIVHMYYALASRVLIKAKEIGLMRPGYVWILTNGVTDDLCSIDVMGIESMEGVLGVKSYIHNSKELDKFRSQWRKRFPRKDINVYGLWAYDATTALAVAIEEAGTNNLTFSNAYRGRNVSELEALGLSQYGPKLLQTLSRVQFKGFAGDFRFVSGQLEPSGFEIVNVVGTGMKRGSFALLIPLLWKLWLASFVYFLLTGITVWVVEHRVNQDFRGSVTYQGSTMRDSINHTSRKNKNNSETKQMEGALKTWRGLNSKRSET